MRKYDWLIAGATFVEDHLTKKKRQNNGELTQYRIEGNHEALIEPVVFDQLQVERHERHELYKARKGVVRNYPFSYKIICDHCGKRFIHKVINGKEKWLCNHFGRKIGRFN